MSKRTWRLSRSVLGLGLGAAIAMAYVASCNNETTAGTDLAPADVDMSMNTTGGDDLAMMLPPDMAVTSAPVVTQSNPAAVSNGGGAMITLTGQNFVQGATVTIGGVAATNVVVVNGTTITLTAPAKSATCGAVAVVVTNPDGKTGSASNILRYTSRTFGLMAAVNTAANSLSQPRNLVVADFDADGKLDVLVSQLNAGVVSFLKGSGGATLGAAMNTNVATQPRAIAFAQIDAGMTLDAVVANSGSNTISVLTGSGTGTFTAKPTVPVGNSPNAVILRDFDGDGKLDLAVANPGGGMPTSASLSVALGNGDGTFKAPSTLMTPQGSTGMAVGDLDKDGKLDLVIAHGAQGSISFLKGQAGGVFAAPVPVPAGGATARADDIVVADFNGDQNLDLAVANGTSNNVSVMLGQGNGTFAAPQTTATNGNSPNSVIAVDMNSDGFLDLVTPNQGGSNISLMLGQAAGKFAAGTTYTVGTGPFYVTSGDLNGDLQPDLVSSNGGTGNLSVILNQCN